MPCVFLADHKKDRVKGLGSTTSFAFYPTKKQGTEGKGRVTSRQTLEIPCFRYPPSIDYLGI